MFAGPSDEDYPIKQPDMSGGAIDVIEDIQAPSALIMLRKLRKKIISGKGLLEI